MPTIHTLPDSGITIEISDEINTDGISSLIKLILVDDVFVKEFKSHPADHLKQFGIKISTNDLSKLSDSDVIAALGIESKGWGSAVAIGVTIGLCM